MSFPLHYSIAGTGYTGPIYGFLLKGARKFRKPSIMKAKLGFVEM